MPSARRALAVPGATVFLLVGACALSAPTPSQAAVVRVPSDRSTIQAGIDACSEGDTVLVASDTYRGVGNRNIDFGGINVRLLSENGSESTVVDCEDAARAFFFHTGEDTTCRVQGFTIRDGRGDYGGAVRCQGASPWFYDCVFSSNTATSGGGAIHANSTSAPRIEGCTLSANSASSGGAAYSDGSAGSFIDCRFTDNQASMFGGAVYLTWIAETSFASCEFARNEAANYGGAVYSVNAESAFDRCAFVANEAGEGGGVYLQTDFNVNEFTNCTFADNSGGGVCIKDAYPVITRSVLAFDRTSAGVVCKGFGEPSIEHCFVYGNAGGDTLCGVHADNSFEDPRLCGVFDGDVGLCSDSPCTAASSPWGVLVGSMLTGCPSCGSGAEPTSWGLLKAMFRRPDGY